MRQYFDELFHHRSVFTIDIILSYRASIRLRTTNFIENDVWNIYAQSILGYIFETCDFLLRVSMQPFIRFYEDTMHPITGDSGQHKRLSIVSDFDWLAK